MTTTERDKKIIQMSIDIALIKQALTGNGTRGLDERVGDLEKWKEKLPKEKMRVLLVRIAIEISIVVAIFKGIDLLIKL